MNRRLFLTETAAVIGMLFFGKLSAKQADANVILLKNGNWLAKVLRADYPNGNKRIYPRAIVEKIVEDYKPPLIVTRHETKQDRLQSAYPALFDNNGDLISHVIKKMHINDDYLMAEIFVLPGELQNSLMQQKIEFRTKGIGALNNLGNGYQKITSYKFTNIQALPTADATTL